MDEGYYPINYCPFCGCEINGEEEHIEQDDE